MMKRLDSFYKEVYSIHRLSLVNIIDYPTRYFFELEKSKKLFGGKKISHIIRVETPKIACFI